MNIGQRTVPVPLNPGESQIAECYGAVGHVTGGKLIVTNQRLIFQPWDMSLAQALVKMGCQVLGVPHSGGVNYIVGKLKGIVDRTAQGIGDIANVERVGMASVTSLPKIGITKTDGSYAEFGIVYSPTTINFSPKNNQVRDQMASLLQSIFL
jgi:hypothetical protein